MLYLTGSMHKVLSQKVISGTMLGCCLFSKWCQPADVLPEVGGLAFGLGQHEHLLLGKVGRQRGMLLPHQEIVICPGDNC